MTLPCAGVQIHSCSVQLARPLYERGPAYTHTHTHPHPHTVPMGWASTHFCCGVKTCWDFVPIDDIIVHPGFFFSVFFKLHRHHLRGCLNKSSVRIKNKWSGVERIIPVWTLLPYSIFLWHKAICRQWKQSVLTTCVGQEMIAFAKNLFSSFCYSWQRFAGGDFSVI